MAPIHGEQRLRPRRLLLLTLALCALSLPSPAVQGPPPDQPSGQAGLETEEGLRHALDDIEGRYEKACKSVQVARYGLMTAAPGDATVTSLRRARADLAAVFESPRLQEVLSEWGHRRTVTRDPALTRRVKLWEKLRQVASIELDPEVSAAADALAAEMAHKKYSLDGQPVSRGRIQQILAESPDPAARKKAWLARAAMASEVSEEVLQLLDLRALRAQKNKEQHYQMMIYDADDLDPTWIFNIMEGTVRRTRPAYMAVLYEMKQAIGQERLDPWDLEYAMTVLWNKKAGSRVAEESFPREAALPTLQRLADSLGFRFDSLPVETSWMDLPSPSVGVALDVPGEYRVAVDPLWQATGAELYKALFKEFGRALKAVRTKQEAPILKGYDCIPGALNAPYAAGIEQSFAWFLHDPLFLKSQMGMSKKDVAAFLEAEKARDLFDLRKLLLRMGTEFTIYGNPDADLDKRYRSLFERAMGIQPDADVPLPWQDDITLATHPVGAHADLLGGLMATEVQRQIKERFGDQRFTSKEVADWLVDTCLSRGEWLPYQERLGKTIKGGLDMGAYLEPLGVEW